MIPSLIIVFREMLEAGLVIGIVLAATRGIPGRGMWTAGGVFLGVAGAALVAAFADQVYSAFAGSGQEIFNACALGIAVVMLGWHNIWMTRHGKEIATQMKSVGSQISTGERPLYILAVVVATAILREGSEVVLFLYGIAAAGGSNATQMLSGSAIGIALGAAVSAALYLGLLRIPLKHLFSVTGILITLLAAGMASQATAFLTQAGLVSPIVDQLWDTSWLLADNSWLGLTLHILVGYTDRPSAAQLIVYVTTVVVIVGLMRVLNPRVPQPASDLGEDPAS